MAQRKPKQSLIAEIPKPRLTDEELMEMFYRGERKNSTSVEADEFLIDSLRHDTVPTPGVAKEIESQKNKPEIQEPLNIKPSCGKPFLQESYFKEPIQENPGSTTTLSTSATISSVDPNTGHTASSIISGQHYSPADSVTEDPASTQSSQEVKILPIDNLSVETDNDNVDEELIAKKSIGSLEKGFLRKGISKESLLVSNVRTSSGEALKKAFDILPMMSALEQLIYLWFLNMSHEVGRESCRATMSLLQRATGISEKLVRENIRSLLRKGCLDLLDGGAAGKAALYRVALPEEAAHTIIALKGSVKEPFHRKPTEKLASIGNLPKGNLPSHIERESFSYTLSDFKEPSQEKASLGEGFLQYSLPTKIADSVIDRFYSMTGQTRISRQKRERSRSQLLDLMQQGFQVDDVLYAIEWARGNISGPIHSFGLIPEIIGQAISKRPGTPQGQAPRQERSIEQRSSKSDTEVEKEQKEHERLETIYTALADDEQNALRSEAILLVESEFGSHVPGQQTLVRIKLMEILRERYGEQGSLERKGG